MEISLKSQPATSRNVSSSSSTTFWFTARGSPGEKGSFRTTAQQPPQHPVKREKEEQESIQKHYDWLTMGKKLDMENLTVFVFFIMQAKQKQQQVCAAPVAVPVWMYMCYRHTSSFVAVALASTNVFPAECKHSVVPFPRVSGKKSTKRTKSINGPLNYVFRGRINTEVMEVENVEDGTGLCFLSSITFENCLYVHSCNSCVIFGYFWCKCHVT